MMIKDSCQYGNSHICFREVGEGFPAGRLRHQKYYDVCPICNEQVKSGGVILVISNQAGLPNTVIHTSCYTTAEETATKLIEAHKEGIRSLFKCLPWFAFEGLSQAYIEKIRKELC